MSFSYLFENESTIAVDKKIEELIKEKGFAEATTSTYDIDEVMLEVALEDLDTYSFLADKKVVIIKNIENIQLEENKKDIEHLYKYLDNPNPDNLLIFHSKKLNNTLKLTKELKKKCEVIEVSTDPIKYVKNSLKDYKIQPNLIEYIVDKCQRDLSRIENECNKLKTYKIEEKEITKKDIDEMVIEKLGDQTELTFAFSRSLASKDTKDALEKYYELLAYDIEPLGVIGLLASQLRIIYQVKVLEKRRMSDNEIATTLGEKNSYRIKKTRELTRYYTEKELLELMKTLEDMDVRIKTSDVDPNSLLELFILNIK